MSRLRRLFGREILAETILVHGKDQPIGDAFIQSRFFHELRCLYPNAHITFAVSLGGSAYANSLKSVMAPYLDEVLTHQGLSLDRRALSPLSPRPLAGRRFDLVIDLEKVWWQTLILRRVRHGGFVSASKHFLFSDCWPRDWRKPEHLSEQYLMLLDALGTAKKVDLPPPDFRCPERMAQAATLLPPGPKYVGLVPGAGDRGKCWPLERYFAVARALIAGGLTPVFLLGPAEADLVPIVRASFESPLLPAWILQADGSATFHPAFSSPLMTVALGRHLCAAVTNDCGMAHMLAAANTPLLTLFGYTNPKKYMPLSSISEVISARHYGTIQPEAIPVEDVLPRIKRLVRQYS
jgi:ADP-heptose:LPS heptosyltransferase